MKRTVLFAGGGTGGHLSPGLAIAEALKACAAGVSRVFACSTRPIDALMLGETGERFVPLHAAPLGRRPAQVWRFVRGWRAANREAMALLAEESVGVVVSLGGFVAAPVVGAASRRGVPVIMLNLDAVPGKANRLMAGKCDAIYSTCDTPAFPAFSRHRVPMPLRRNTLAATFGDQAACKSTLGFDPLAPVLLVTGASLGAQTLNELMLLLVQRHAQALRGWQVYHLAGQGREKDLADGYRRAGIHAHVEPFQHRMGLAWGSADLVISRAGANSVAEIAANAVPAIFLPYPFHRDRHQHDNALPLVKLGGAVIVDDLVNAEETFRGGGNVIAALLTDQAARNGMRDALFHHRPPNGAEIMAERILAMAAGAMPL